MLMISPDLRHEVERQVQQGCLICKCDCAVLRRREVERLVVHVVCTDGADHSQHHVLGQRKSTEVCFWIPCDDHSSVIGLHTSKLLQTPTAEATSPSSEVPSHQ